MKIDKSKKDKIKQGNLKDFDLLYDVLVSGGTYSDYKSELLDRSMPQEQLNFDISEDDILAAWILGKDEESELYARGGHIHQYDTIINYNAATKNFPKYNFGLDNTSTTASSPSTGSSESISSGGFDIGSGLSSIATPAGQLVDNTIVNWLDTGNYGDWKTDIQGESIDPLARLAGNIGGAHTDNAIERLKAERLSNDPNFAIGDTASNLSQYYAYIRDRGPKKQEIQTRDWGARVMDNLNASGQGALQGAKFGPWGALIGGIIGGVANIPSQILEDKNRQKLNNEILKYNIGLDQGLKEFDTNLTNSYKMQLWNQLQQPYLNACGGKMKNRLASGGYINSHYDYITDPLVKVDAGGTHQENPNEGVLTSIAPDGQPNLVEEGETIINSGQEDAYVFSDRIVADDEILKSHLLPNKFAGKTYADISKELDKIIEEHKNDEISKRTFDEMVSRLQQAQEDQKFKEKQEEIEKFLDGLTDEQKEQLEQTMVEEAQAEQQVAEEQAIAEQQAQELAAQEQLMQPEQAPEQVAIEQSLEQIVPSRYDQMMSRALFADAANLGMFQLGGFEKTAADTYFYTTHPKIAFDKTKREYKKQDLQFKKTSYGLIVSSPIPSITDVYENIKDKIDDYKALKSIERLMDYETDRLYERLPKKHVSDYIFDLINNLTGYPTISDNKKSNGGHLHQELPWIKSKKQSRDNYVFPSVLTYKANNPDEFLTGTSQYDGTYIYKDDDGNYREAYYPIQDSVWLDNTNDPNRQQYSDYSQGFVTMFDKWNNLRQPNRIATDSNTIASPRSSYDAFGNSYGSGFGVLNGKFRDSALLGYTTSNGDNIVLNGSKGVANPISNSTEVKQLASRPLSNGNSSTNSNITIGRWSSSGKYAPGTTYSGLNKKDKASFDEYYKNTQLIPEEAFDKLSPRSFGNTNNTTSTATTDNNNTNNAGSVSGTTTDYSTWLRYAPAIGSGIQYLSDLFGITNRNDFSNADMFQRRINDIPNVGFVPLGNYMTYSPLDETYQQNVARSQYNAARRAIQNNASGNASAAIAAMDSLNGNMNNTFGDLALQSRQYNDAQRKAVDEFNANIARINSMMSLSAQEKNQAIAAEKAKLTYQLANMRENIQNMNDAAKSANFNNLMTNLGNIGRENYIMNQVNNNLAYYYRDNGDGTYSYKYGLTNAEREAAERYAKENGLTIK